MRRTVIILSCLLLALALTSGIFLAYSYHEEEVPYDDLLVKYSIINSEGEFIGEFSAEKNGRWISGVDYQIDGNTLYITLLQTAGSKKALDTDEEKYAEIRIPDCSNIQEVYYYYAGENEKMEVKK